jgi:signal transduction histidine kinase
MKRIGFRARLLLVLVLFAAIPSAILTAAYTWSVAAAIREVSGPEPWEMVGQTGVAALEIAERNTSDPAELAKIRAHRESLSASITNARRLDVYTQNFFGAIGIVALLAFILLGLAAVRVAGHLSRQLSRPLQELVLWTEMIARSEKLPELARGRGAPEFETLRQRMRMAERELGRSRDRAVEAERLRAFRESARQVAHELKNLLTPIRFAVSRLKQDASESQSASIEVLEVETERMNSIARSFSQFGRLPEGPESEIDVGELVTYTAHSTVPENVALSLDIDPGVPLIRGHHDALSRALANVLLNAVEASPPGGAIRVKVRRSASEEPRVEIEVEDEGGGIESEKLATIWEPYVTHKAGGTGLGLAIVKQTIEAHGGSVAARSVAGSGTAITFRLPFLKVNDPPASAAR